MTPSPTIAARCAAAAAVALLAALLAVGPAPPASAGPRTALSGGTPVEAATAWSRFAFPQGADTVVIARDDAFPDSLASGAMQQREDGPLLLTRSDRLDAAVATEIDRLDPARIIVLGGDRAVEPQVVQQLEARAPVTRLAGATRVETAVEIAEELFADATTAVLARADGPGSAAFADTLAGGGYAGALDAPVLLTQSGSLHPGTRAWLADSDVDRVVVLGGTAAVAQRVVDEVGALGLDVRRLSGAVRAATAVALAEDRGFGNAAAADTVVLIEGSSEDAWAAGFTAAAFSAADDAPVVLANGPSLPPETSTWLAERADGSTALVCAPGVDPEACEQARGLLDPDIVETRMRATLAPTSHPPLNVWGVRWSLRCDDGTHVDDQVTAAVPGGGGYSVFARAASGAECTIEVDETPSMRGLTVHGRDADGRERTLGDATATFTAGTVEQITFTVDWAGEPEPALSEPRDHGLVQISGDVGGVARLQCTDGTDQRIAFSGRDLSYAFPDAGAGCTAALENPPPGLVTNVWRIGEPPARTGGGPVTFTTDARAATTVAFDRP